MSQSTAPTISIVHYFGKLTDPRLRRRRRHELVDILVVAICATICGCKSWGEIAIYGRQKREWLETFLNLPNGIPCADTFRRLFARIKPAVFQSCFRQWMDQLAATLGVKQIAIDGKTVRRSHDRGLGNSALHMVSAWATENHLTLGQVAVRDKSNEITAIPKLLELLQLSGAIVTIDAMGCQKEIATQIREQGGDYVLAVKGNQERLLEDIQTCFVAELDKPEGQGNYSYHETNEKGHGRKESRQYLTILDPEGIRDRELWTDLRTITMVVTERQVGNSETTTETRYYIGSKVGKAKQYARYIRGHWGIENSLHWILDMVYDEDRNRTRKGHSQENLTFLRRLSVSVLKNTKACKGSTRIKQLQAMTDNTVLEGIMSAFQVE